VVTPSPPICPSLPLREVGVFLEQLVQVDDDVVPRETDRVPVHAARRATFDERAVGAVLRLVLRALKAVVAGVPAQRRVLMGAGEPERVHALPRAREDDVVPLVDLHAVRRGDGVRPLLVVRGDRRDPPERHRLRAARRHADRREGGGSGAQRVEKEVPPAGERASGALLGGCARLDIRHGECSVRRSS